MSNDAVSRYKALADRNTQAVRKMQENDRKVVEDLRAKLTDAATALAQATERERVSKLSVETHWELVAEALWGERWLRIGDRPPPVVPPGDVSLAEADAAVGRAYDALQDALRQRKHLTERFGGKRT
jgi:hypothetical protein